MYYVVTVDIEVSEGINAEIFTEEFSGIKHMYREQARQEIVDALSDPIYAGYCFDIKEVEV